MPLEAIVARTAAMVAAGTVRSYPEHAGGAAKANRRVALPVLPCAWGKELTGRERKAHGKGHTKVWKWCDHPQDGRGRMTGKTGLPLGKKVVCTCDGCGPNCRGYEAGGAKDDGSDHIRRAPDMVPPAGIVVPQPPALDLKPTRSRALVTVVVGDEAERCFAVSGPLMERYAERVGADLVVLRWPGHPDWPMSAKFAIGRVLDHYDRIAYVDADVLLRPAAVDLFEMCPADCFGAVNQLHQTRLVPQFGREREHQRFRAEMGFPLVAHLPWYFNAGVMVVPKSHQRILLPPAGPIPARHCSEEDHTNATLLDSGLPYCLLDDRCNRQNWWSAPGFADAPPDAVLHFSGGGAARRNRAADMRACAAG